jgi:hypothetical protein
VPAETAFPQGGTVVDRDPFVDDVDEEFPPIETVRGVLPPALEELESQPMRPLLEDDDEIEAALAALLPEGRSATPRPNTGGTDFSNLDIGDEVGFLNIGTDEVLEELEGEFERDDLFPPLAEEETPPPDQGDFSFSFDHDSPETAEPSPQDRIDSAVDAADAAGDFVDRMIEFDFGDDDDGDDEPAPLRAQEALDLGDLDISEEGDREPTFISDMPSAALASDLVNDADNRLGGGRALDELLEPEEPLASDRVHGVEDFIADSPSTPVPIGIDLDETLAALEDGAEKAPPPPPGPPPPPPPGHRRAQSTMPPPPPPTPPRPPKPESNTRAESLSTLETIEAVNHEIEVDLDDLEAARIETFPPDDGDSDGDSGAGDGDKKKKGFFKRIFGKD